MINFLTSFTSQDAFVCLNTIVHGSPIPIEVGTDYHPGMFHAWFSHFQVSGYMLLYVPLFHWCINRRSHVNGCSKHLPFMYPAMWDHIEAFTMSIHGTANDVNHLLQSFTIILLISSWSFVPRLPFMHPICCCCCFYYYYY